MKYYPTSHKISIPSLYDTLTLIPNPPKVLLLPKPTLSRKIHVLNFQYFCPPVCVPIQKILICYFAILFCAFSITTNNVNSSIVYNHNYKCQIYQPFTHSFSYTKTKVSRFLDPNISNIRNKNHSLGSNNFPSENGPPPPEERENHLHQL